jgi:WD40 repeat protein
MAYVVEDGTAWRHIAGSREPTFLYKHQADPYRVAVSPTGDVASGAHDGSVMAYDLETATVHTASTPHTDRVAEISWRGTELLTISWDRTARTWNRSLTLTNTTQSDGPLIRLRVSDSGWISSVAATRLWVHEDKTDLVLDTRSTIRDLSLSSDGRFACAVAGSDLLVYDIQERTIAAVRISGNASRAQFVNEHEIFANLSTGEVVSLSARAFPFVKLDIK